MSEKMKDAGLLDDALHAIKSAQDTAAALGNDHSYGKIGKAREAVVALIAERDTLRAENVSLHGDRNALLAIRETVMGEADGSLHQVVKQLIAQRDALLAALKVLLGNFESQHAIMLHLGNPQFEAMQAQAKDAIAQHKGDPAQGRGSESGGAAQGESE